MSYPNPFVAYTGTSQGAPLVGGQDLVSQKLLEVLWAGKDLGMAQQFQDGEIRKLKVTLKNPLVLDEEHRRELFGTLPHARVVDRVREDNENAEKPFDGVVFIDTVDGMEVSDVIAVFPRTNDMGKTSVDHAVQVIGKTTFIDAIDDWVTTPGFHDPKIMTADCPWADERVAANDRAIKENFADWFGNSQVVDAAGNPLVVHHGTRANFDAFDLDMQGRNGSAIGPGFYFTDSEGVAASYGNKLLAVYLKAENPTLSLTEKTITKKQVQAIIEDMERQEPYFLSNYGDVGTMGRRAVLNAALDDIHATAGNDAEVIGAIIRVGGVEKDAVMRSVIDRTRKDGFVVGAEIASGAAQDGEKVYVVLRPGQIKSAIGNSGLYLKSTNSMSDVDEARRLELAGKALSAVGKAKEKTNRMEIRA
jgi:ADP-Ribosyltransferase in polyvalent proteins